jgi:DNA-binding MarR family transcriptional regulator
MAARGVVTRAASTPATAELVGALFDLIFHLRRDTSGGTLPVLVRLAADGPMRACDLAAALHLDQSTVSRHVTSLESEGLVERIVDDSDRRSYLLRLTGPGADEAQSALAARIRRFESAVRGWDQDDIGRLATLLTAFVDGLDDPERTTE